nr:hypothetical protein [Methanosphaera sp. ISO3-F5]WQH63332.1 hypothetical protein PXD04_06355 [Methanosphaera sp. ISO3-F5]
MIVQYKAQTLKHNAGTSVAPVKAQVTTSENIEKIKLPTNDTSSSKYLLNNKKIPITRKKNKIPETTNIEVSETKPN